MNNPNSLPYKENLATANYFLRNFRAANIACLVARRLLVFLERDVLFFTSCDNLFAIKYSEKNYE